MKPEWMSLVAIGGTTLYALLGVVIFWISFIIVDKISPYKLWEEIVEHRNLALAIVVRVDIENRSLMRGGRE